ncbi:putative proteasome regulatory particle subunit [Xylona heveae TC161]|uniref:Putative proteasome regulatory particle subunit n=1 Tax=Xylona heveae (strain CBS 132557 / TC161) TaxID=1328760 RepID=A0A164ZBM4_XYLHT|nr:putative proteasome regulatory particle subunit [Xylona heveae TC161]KZF18903.1 putative proteasome regulatory particle subunit [Xylona heveae TC161]
MDLDTIPNFLADQRDAAPADLQHLFVSFEDFWERRLWHQLTDVLLEYFHHSESGPQRITIYKTFVLSFGDKINQLKLVILGLKAAAQYKDNQERLKFLKSLADKVNKPSSQDAWVYATAAVARVKLELSDYEGARKELDSAERALDSFDSVETVVHASFYQVNADFYHAKMEFASYYKNALLYLACINISDLTSPGRETRAYDLSIAALVSDDIYNFGELLLHPILDSLSNSQHSWLRELLFAFNGGDLAAYDVLAGNMSKNKLLHDHQEFLYKKISLSALTEAVFRRPPHDRTMTFASISKETKVQPDEIEHLVMKALSLGLLRGSIDQVSQMARINWVQPKVLDMKQIDNMRARLKDWDAGVNQLGNWIEGVGKDVWAA